MNATTFWPLFVGLLFAFAPGIFSIILWAVFRDRGK